MIGQKLNKRYTITARLGKGGMGTVYRASDEQTGQEVAVKVIASELALNPEGLERFRREGEALRQLDHPNIVKFLEAFQQEDQVILVMEYVSGGSLHDLLLQGRLPVDRVLQISLDLCDALIRAHRLNIIHRDIKPENVLLTQNGIPKLADFGVARLNEDTRMTRSGTQVGTPYYMSPEAWEGKALNFQADIWSLGVLLFEMLAGQVPFGGDTPLAVMNKIFTSQPPDLKRLRADVSPGLVKIVGRMLTRDKKRRYQTMREVAVDLERGQQSTTPRPAEYVVKDVKKIDWGAVGSPVKDSFKKILASLKSTFAGVISFSGKAGIFALVLVLLVFLSISLFANFVNNPLIFAAETANDVSIYSYDVNDRNISVIDVGGGKNWDPIMDLNGNIYFTSHRDGKAEIYRLIDGKVERVTNTKGKFESWGPALSTTGVLYFTSNRDGKAEVYRRTDEATERVTHTEGSFESWGPALSATGEIYFTSNRDGKIEIYRRIDEKSERVTNTKGNFISWGPIVSATGEIYFTSNRDGKVEVYRRIEEKTERVTNTEGSFKSWGAVLQGADVYFTSNRSGQMEIYLLGSDAIGIFNIEGWTGFLDDERSPGY